MYLVKNCPLHFENVPQIDSITQNLFICPIVKWNARLLFVENASLYFKGLSTILIVKSPAVDAYSALEISSTYHCVSNIAWMVALKDVHQDVKKENQFVRNAAQVSESL